MKTLIIFSLSEFHALKMVCKSYGKKLRRSDRIGGSLISILFIAITAVSLSGLIESSGAGPALSLVAASKAAGPVVSVNFTVPEWSGYAATAGILLVAGYLILLLPRLNTIYAGIYSFVILGILIGSREILLLTSAKLTHLHYPAMLLIIGNLYFFFSRLFAADTQLHTSAPDQPDDWTGSVISHVPGQAGTDNNHRQPSGTAADMPSLSRTKSNIPTTKIEPVRTSLGRYNIENEIGKGAMGVVYQGRDPKINRIVAIKTLNLAREFDKGEIAEVKARFFREAETAGRLAHPNIVTIYDAGEDGDLAFIAMEYLKGHDLKRYIRANRLLPPRTVVQIVILAAEALHYAHQQNVIHRDVKPGNIMFLPESATIKITDFGIARITDSNRTKTGVVLGTPSYMSPEQLTGNRNLDGRTDLFSLGVMFYQLLCGELPFTGDSLATLMVRIAREPYRDIAAIRPDLIKNTPVITQILDKILAKDPEHRYQSGGELSIDLRSCLKYIKKK